MRDGHDISHSLQTTEPGYFALVSATEVSLPLGFGSIVAADNLTSDRGDDCLAIVAASSVLPKAPRRKGPRYASSAHRPPWGRACRSLPDDNPVRHLPDPDTERCSPD